MAMGGQPGWTILSTWVSKGLSGTKPDEHRVRVTA